MEDTFRVHKLLSKVLLMYLEVILEEAEIHPCF